METPTETSEGRSAPGLLIRTRSATVGAAQRPIADVQDAPGDFLDVQQLWEPLQSQVPQLVAWARLSPAPVAEPGFPLAGLDEEITSTCIYTTPLGQTICLGVPQLKFHKTTQPKDGVG